ncbi:MAG: hypothetical protein HKM91_01650 [Altererythrobacter sp.]|nr:hypothetical protein [Altererythrobacter sp.]
MKRFILAVAMGLLPASLCAQEALPDSAQPEQVSPEQDLDRALFVALMGGKADEERKASVAAVMTYFIGRYEAISGSDFGTAASERLKQVKLVDIFAQDEVCLPRLQILGTKMGEYGEIFKGSQAEQQNQNSPND